MIQGIQNIIKTLDKNKPCALFFPLIAPFKIGSENVIILECFDLLKELNICHVVTSNNEKII